MAGTKIGKITHFYPKIGVAVVDLSAPVSVGDMVSFTGSNDFSQAVESMQVEHESITRAKKGDTIGLKVDQPVKPGDIIVKS